jgi:hypothetical protein
MEKIFSIEGVKVDFTKSDEVTVDGTNYSLEPDNVADLTNEDYNKVKISSWKNKRNVKVFNLDEKLNVNFDKIIIS